MDTEQKKRGRGRPKVGREILVAIPDEMLAALDAVAGKGKRGEFIREAIAREIERRRVVDRDAV